MYWLNRETSPIVLASGRLSNWFVDTDPFFDDLEVRDIIVDMWAKKIMDDIPQEERGKKEVRIFGVPTGGVRWAKSLWLRLRHSSLLLYEYRDKRYAENTYIVDDVLTTGSTIKSLGANGEPVLCVVRRRAPNCDLVLSTAQTITSWMDIQIPIGGGKE